MEEVVSSNLTRSTKHIPYTFKHLRRLLALFLFVEKVARSKSKVQTRSKTLFSTDLRVVWIGPRFLPAQSH